MREITTIERLVKYMECKGINNNQITNKAGLSVGLIGKAITKKTGLNSDSIEKILYYYEDLNSDWLLTGRGEMLRKTDEKNQNISSKGHQIVNSHSSAIITADKNMNELKKENNTLKKRINELEKDKEFLQNLLTKLKK